MEENIIIMEEQEQQPDTTALTEQKNVLYTERLEKESRLKDIAQETAIGTTTEALEAEKREISRRIEDIDLAIRALDGDEPTEEELLTIAKRRKVEDIEIYDKSDAVNSFLLNGTENWLDRDTRVAVTRRATATKTLGQETTTLWFGTTALEVSCDKALQLLDDLELYASRCYDTTAAHKKAVSELESVEDLVAYDYTTGYPEKLTLTV